MCRQKLSRTLAGKQIPMRNAKPWSHRKHCPWVFFPLPCTAFFSPFLCDNKRAPSPLAAALHLWALPKSRDLCVSEQLSYHKGSEASKKGAKNRLQQHTIYGRKSKTAQMECKVWVLGDGTSQPGLCPLFCLGGKTRRLGDYRNWQSSYMFSQVESPQEIMKRNPHLVKNRANIPFLRHLAKRLRKERRTLTACTAESFW